jgi:hypothetical protein
MFIKQRQIRRSSKFTSRWSRGSLNRREHTASMYTTGVIQLFLVWRYALPAAMTLIALFVLKVLIGNIREAVALHKDASSHRK